MITDITNPLGPRTYIQYAFSAAKSSKPITAHTRDIFQIRQATKANRAASTRAVTSLKARQQHPVGQLSAPRPNLSSSDESL
jgi:hypothetical protein